VLLRQGACRETITVQLAVIRSHKEITVKRLLLVMAAAVMFVSTLATPSFASFDGGGGGTTGCGGNTICKP
jgi:hypothetical protein